MENLGKKVSYYRKAKGYSIKELAANLCDESTIYRLEQGKQLPRLEILNDICLKLEIPFKTLFPLDEEVEELKRLCREFTYTEDYLSLDVTLEECNKVLEELNSIYVKEEFRKFIKWHQAVLLHKKEHRAMDALCILNSLVKLNNCASELDIAILNSIGLIHLSMKNEEQAHEIYSVIYNRIKKQKNVEDITLFPRVAYNYAYTLYKLEHFSVALDVTYDIHYYLETHQLLYSLGKIYHMIGLLLEKHGNFSDAEQAFKNAILVFTLTKDELNLVKAENDLASLDKISVIIFGVEENLL